jgi:TonB-dependent SusC/RagA subfamily outer membrane receptor
MSPRVLPLVVFAAVVTSCVHQGSPRPQPEKSAQPSSGSSTVTANEIAQQPGKPIEEILAGRIAGVQVGRNGEGALTVRIRGVSSLNSSNEPLYVIDGIPIQAGPGGSLAGINPSDIESIRVLKDAIATSEYGSRGANGVIIIKMKKPGPR